MYSKDLCSLQWGQPTEQKIKKSCPDSRLLKAGSLYPPGLMHCVRVCLDMMLQSHSKVWKGCHITQLLMKRLLIECYNSHHVSSLTWHERRGFILEGRSANEKWRRKKLLSKMHTARCCLLCCTNASQVIRWLIWSRPPTSSNVLVGGWLLPGL